ncbi:MFS transporter, partial [Bacillaceae bacterium Marseille-Q3522]|nr:MFS transporter [Bacillaceae bacterium Marseille-Q3522]
MKTAFSFNLIILYFGRFITNIGDWVYMIALTLILSEGKGVELTFLWMIRTLAPFILRFFAGSVTDRVGPKLSIILSYLLRGIGVAVIPLFLNSWILFICVFFVSSLSPFFSSSFQPIISSLTDDSNRHRINSILTTIGASALFIGPLIGSILFEYNISLAFKYQAITFLACAVLFLFVKVKIEDAGEENFQKNLKTIFVFLK